MARPGDTVADPVSGSELVFRETAGRTGGALLQIDVRAAPRWSAGPLHVHPKQEERVEVVSGKLASKIRGRKRSHARGDVIRVPPNTPHTLWNDSAEEVRLVIEFRPALRTEFLFETAFGLGRTRRTRTSLLELARLFLRTRAYRDEVRLARPRIDKRRLTTALARYGVNPLVELAFRVGVIPPGYALLETTGRRSGKVRRTPVGYERDNGTIWIVAEHGRRAGYVRNLEAEPQVRVRFGGRWHSGRAEVVPGDDAAARLTRVGTAISRAAVRAMGTELLTVRVELEDASAD